MKKLFKIIFIVLLSISAVLILLFVTVRIFSTDIYKWMQIVELTDSGEYQTEAEDVYRFTYAHNDSTSVEIAQYFQLDTLSGDTTWERALKLGRKVAQAIPHGNPDPETLPSLYNAITLWEHYAESKDPLNCRHHSIILNDLLLASGITSRYVTCMPMDENDNDCHVVNIVFLPEINKWAMIDSDQNKYLTDEHGTPLSLQQLRESLISKQPIKVYNLYGDSENSNYLGYMAKNNYWFTCIEQSCVNSDQNHDLRSIHLVAGDHKPFKTHPGRKHITTSDPDQFWRIPNQE